VWNLGGTSDDYIYLSFGQIVHFLDNHEGGNTYNVGTVKEYYYDANAETKTGSGEDQIGNFIQQRITGHNLNDVAVVFDIDGTLNVDRNMPIEEKTAAQLAELLIMGVDIQIITGKSEEEFEERRVFVPLIDELKRRNSLSCINGMIVYTSDGAGKFVFNENGNLVIDKEYSDPFSEDEASVMEKVIHEIAEELNKTYGLKESGIVPYIRNFGNLKFNFSPYGSTDRSQYAFENDPGQESRGQTHCPSC